VCDNILAEIESINDGLVYIEPCPSCVGDTVKASELPLSIVCDDCPCYEYERDYCQLFNFEIKSEKLEDEHYHPVSKKCRLQSIKSALGEHRPTKRAGDTATPYEYEVVLHK
jgi:hypothetical protein